MARRCAAAHRHQLRDADTSTPPLHCHRARGVTAASSPSPSQLQSPWELSSHLLLPCPTPCLRVPKPLVSSGLSYPQASRISWPLTGAQHLAASPDKCLVQRCHPRPALCHPLGDIPPNLGTAPVIRPAWGAKNPAGRWHLGGAALPPSWASPRQGKGAAWTQLGMHSRGKRGAARGGCSQGPGPGKGPWGAGESRWRGRGEGAFAFLTSLLGSREDGEEEEDSGEEGCSCLPCHLLKQCPRAPAGSVFYPRAA